LKNQLAGKIYLHKRIDSLKADPMLSTIMIFYVHQNLQYLISTMSFLHTIKQYFSKSLRPAIIKASRESDKQKGK
ncbi:hypothetical protein OCH80_08650, partial [Lactobacillus sp. 23-2]|uniref:hypothetical protein n=1 Tax=Lactobacillus sp. 23-2 TaxID=2981842 RepID=UPI003836425B